jgi:hypothetical protein
MIPIFSFRLFMMLIYKKPLNWVSGVIFGGPLGPNFELF